MSTYLTISVGDRPQDAKPILASDDRAVVAAALEALIQRAGTPPIADVTEQDASPSARSTR